MYPVAPPSNLGRRPIITIPRSFEIDNLLEIPDQIGRIPSLFPNFFSTRVAPSYSRERKESFRPAAEPSSPVPDEKDLQLNHVNFNEDAELQVAIAESLKTYEREVVHQVSSDDEDDVSYLAPVTPTFITPSSNP